MKDLSPRLQWPIPEENTEPFYDAFVALIAAIDASVYGPAREDRNLLLASSATVTFDAGTGVAAWDAALEVLSAPAGFLWQLPAGSATIPDGSLLYVKLTRAPTSSVGLEVYVGSVVDAVRAEDALVLAFRRGSSIFWRNGKVLPSGASEALFSSSGMSALEVQSGGTTVGSRAKLNFVGATVADNPGSERVDVTVPVRGSTGQKLVTLVPITTSQDTDTAGYTVVGHFALDAADYALAGSVLTVAFLGMGYCTVPGVTGRARITSLDTAYGPVVLEWTGLTDPTEKTSSLSLPAGANRYRVEFEAAGSTSSTERFFLDWIGVRFTRTFA